MMVLIVLIMVLIVRFIVRRISRYKIDMYYQSNDYRLAIYFQANGNEKRESNDF